MSFWARYWEQKIFTEPCLVLFQNACGAEMSRACFVCMYECMYIPLITNGAAQHAALLQNLEHSRPCSTASRLASVLRCRHIPPIVIAATRTGKDGQHLSISERGKRAECSVSRNTFVDSGFNFFFLQVILCVTYPDVKINR